MIALALFEIARLVDGELRPAAPDDGETMIEGPVETDSREIVPGGVFVAKPGEHADGHDFVATAVEAGAALAIVERVVDVPVSQIVVDDVVRALAELARGVVARAREGGDLRVLAVTGSNGKTTTKNMLRRILEQHGETVAPRASFNNAVGAPLTMLRVTAGTRFLVNELGADAPGQIARLAGLVTPDVGIVLMVGMAHAGGMGGIEETARAKSGLIQAVRRGGTAVLNADDPRVAAMASIAEERGARVAWFGRADAPASARPGAVLADDVRVDAEGTSFVLLADGERHDVRLQVVGEHFVVAALAALTAAHEVGVPFAEAVRALETLELAERWRMQPMGSAAVRILNDAYNASPDSMAAALRTLARITGPGERTVAVLGAMSELGEFAGEEHDRIGLLAVRLDIKRIVVVGHEARRLYISAISEGSWDGEAVFFPDADATYDYLMTELREGDRVLVKSSNSVGLRHLGDRLGESFQ